MFTGVLLKILGVFSVLVTIIYLYVRYCYNYWENRGIPSLKPTFPFGNYGPIFMQKATMGVAFQEIYEKSKKPFIGIYAVLTPNLIVCDPKIAQNMLIKDYHYFNGRGFYVNEKTDPLSKHITKTRFSPESAHRLYIITHIYLRRFFDATFMNAVRNGLMFLAPNLMKLLKIKFVDSETEEFMLFAVKKTLEYREKTSTNRKDFMQLLIELKNTGQIKEDTADKESHDITTDQRTNNNNNNNNNTINNNKNNVENGNKFDVKEWSIEEITAQAFAFFIGGFETSSSTLSFCLLELATHPDIQTKVQKEIDEILEKNDNEFTYEGMNQMKYLHAVIEETIRKHPPLSFLIRQCTKEYKIPDTDITIEKGVNVIFPSMGFHNDEKYFKKPEQFLPERFLESKRNFIEAPLMLFGEGPRYCIAMKLGFMQVKSGLVSMLRNFSFA